MEYSKKIMKLGGTFFWIQIMFLILNSTNDFFITQFVGPEYVVEYQLYNRIFTLFSSVFGIALTPIWSAVTKALAENDLKWIKNIYNILIKISFIAMLLVFMIIPFLQYIFDIWLQDRSIEVNYLFAAIIAFSNIINIWNSVLSTISNGIGKLKPQAVLFTIAVIIKLPLSWFLVEIFDSWIYVILANVIAMLAYCILQPIYLNNVFKNKS